MTDTLLAGVIQAAALLLVPVVTVLLSRWQLSSPPPAQYFILIQHPAGTGASLEASGALAIPA